MVLFLNSSMTSFDKSTEAKMINVTVLKTFVRLKRSLKLTRGSSKLTSVTNVSMMAMAMKAPVMLLPIPFFFSSSWINLSTDIPSMK
ncbi:hypothetical protein D3C78_696840 [compost metagenome]